MLTGLTSEKVALVGGFTSPSRDDVNPRHCWRRQVSWWGVSSDTTLVVVGDCTEYNQKVRSARAMGIKVVSLDEFMTFMDTSEASESGVVIVIPIEETTSSNTSSPVTSISRFSEASVSELVEVLRNHTFSGEITSEHAVDLLEAKGMPVFNGNIQASARRDLRVIELKIRELRSRGETLASSTLKNSLLHQ